MANGNCANSGGKWIRPEKREALYKRDSFTCVYCGKSLFDHEGLVLTLDHVVPQELGGTNDASNLVTACKSCNSAKGSKNLRSFLAFLSGQGVDTSEIAKRVRNATKRVVKYGRKYTK
jgi:hypothetical protein